MTRPVSHVPCPIEVSHVWKKYKIGAKHDSLRDALPALLKRFSGRNGHALDTNEFWALKDVSFQATKGETLGIIGPNGAGKSTLLKLLSKICQQTQGAIRIDGRLAALIEVGAGFHPDLTGRENVYLNGTIMGLRRRQIDRLFDRIVAFSELEQFLDMPVKRYSSGMNVRLGFSVAAHVNPDILLVDEVLAVGDLPFQQKCYQRILTLKERGTTLFFISHNLEAIQRLCDRVLLLDKGQVIRDGNATDVILHYRQEVLRKRLHTDSKTRGLGVPASTDLEIVSARLTDAAGQPQEAFETGQAMRLAVQYRAKRPIRNPSALVTIERLDGLICHEASTRTSDLFWNAWSGEGRLTLEYPELNLLPNTYQVIVRFFEDTTPVPIARLFKALYFHITSDKPNLGTVHLEHHWSAATDEALSQRKAV